GIDATLVLSFDADLASWSPDVFVERVLKHALGAEFLLMGFDSAFGKGREGDYDYLEARRDEFGIDVRRAGTELRGGERVSSTLIRELIQAGSLDRAKELLGRDVSLLGKVVRGDERGRTIGFPTANLDIGDAAVLPRGVYFAEVDVLGGPNSHLPAVVNIGRAPTFRGGDEASERFDPTRDRVEVHILDFSGDLYGKTLEVSLSERHRVERQFSSVDELTAQIQRDVEARRDRL
ncbi:MAG: riboflavin kinase, partial [Planctomycetota bacterium]